MSNPELSWEQQVGALPERRREPFLAIGRALTSAIRIQEFNLAIPSMLRARTHQRLVLNALYRGTGEEVDWEAAAKCVTDLNDAVLNRDPASDLHFIFGEGAVTNPVGGNFTHALQLRQILDVASWPNTKVQVLRNDVGEHPGMAGNFKIIKLNPTDEYVVFGSGDGSLEVHEREVVAHRQAAMQELSGLAMNEAVTKEYLGHALASLDWQSG